MVLAKVDATEESALGEKYGVSGFPTMIWFTDGKETEYDGGRDECASSPCEPSLLHPKS